jgi:hypothetical protein
VQVIQQLGEHGRRLLVPPQRTRIQHEHPRSLAGFMDRERGEGERGSSRAVPGFREDQRQLPRRRTFDAGVRVPPPPLLPTDPRRAVLLADIHASGETDAAIDRENLAVVAKEVLPEVGEHGMKEAHLAAAGAHLPPEA